MKKITKFFGVVIALVIPSFLFADGQVKTKVISSEYSRSSISNIVVTYGDRWDGAVVSGVRAINTGSKFDVNVIPTTEIRLKGVFRTAEEQQAALNAAAKAANGGQSTNSFKEMFAGIGESFKSFGSSEKSDTLTQRLLTEYINDNNVGKQIFDFVLGVDNQGRFHYDIMVQRSRWNATDKDVHLDNASQVKIMDAQGPALLANSYIIVYDAKETRISETTNKDGVKVPLYMANVSAYIFVIDSAEDVIGNVLHTMWINDDDDKATKEAKRNAYESVHIPMKCVAAVCNSTSSEKGMSDAICKSYDDILRKAEKKISAWKVSCGLEEVKPYITAKIGTKEGIKNAQRFRIYGNKGDDDEGTLRTVKKGFARATVINDNDTIATGETGVSYLYQISGPILKGTEFIKQSNDIKLGVSVDYNYNGLGMGPDNKIFGALSMVDLTFDYLAHIHKNGISHYGRINIGYDINTAKDLKTGAEKKGIAWYTYASGKNAGKAIYGSGVSYVNVAIGYACGLKVKQVIEFQPYINMGLDMIIPHGFDNTVLTNMSTAVLNQTISFTDKTAKQTFALFVDPGLRLVINCGYPFQIFFQADYAVKLMEWDAYKVLNTYARQCGYGHNMGLGAGFGIKWTF